MVRRAASSATDDSLKENSGVPPSSVTGKRKEVKRERGLRNGRIASRRVQNDDDEAMQEDSGLHDDRVEEREAEDGDEAQDEEQEDEDGDEQGSGSPHGRKRARANTNGDAHPSGSGVKLERTRQVTLPRDTDGYIPGSIVRVQLRNFVTYDYVEFCPGPYLNMILGPNGTGKSSIACAICLGLNFPPSVLGRATDLNSFVKLDTTDGHIEIELKGPRGKSNLVIRRSLKASSKSSQFTINGESASGREVNAKMAELNVQVSNLCSFLPQDRVAEFARMSPQQLLKETQRAAGNENLTAWHDTLISAGKDLTGLETSLEGDRKQLETLEERNATLEREVKRYEERKAIEQRMELLDLLIPTREYQEERAKYEEAKAHRQTMHNKLKALLDANAPIDHFKEDLTNKCNELNRQRESMKSSTKRKFNQMSNKWSDNEKLENQAETLKNQLDGLKQRERNRQSNIKDTEKAIDKLQRDLADPPRLENIEELNEQIRTVKDDYRHLPGMHADLQDRQRASIEEEAKHKAALESANRGLQQLDDASHRKLEALGKWDPHCASVVAWLRRNQHRFKMEVMEPPVLSVTVPDKRYASAVESCFSGNQLKMFVMQCDEDYKLFNQLVCDTTEALGKTMSVSTWCRPHMDIPLPVKPDILREMGFDGYAIEFAQFPEGLRNFLQVDVQLHRVAVGTDVRKIDPNRAMEAFSRSGNAKYILGTVMNNVSRSRYGKQLTQNSTYECRPASKLVTANVDPQVKRKLQSDVDAAKAQLQQVAEQMAKLGEEEKGIRNEESAYKSKLAELTQRKERIVREEGRLGRLRLQLETKTSALQSLKDAPPIDVERNKIKQEIFSIVRQRVKIVKEYQTLVRSTIAEQTEATKLCLQYMQISANLTRFQELCADRQEKIAEATQVFNAARQAFERTKVVAKEKLELSKAKLREVSPETAQIFNNMETTGEISAKTSDEYRSDYDTERANLEMTLGTSPRVIEQYKERKAAIEQLQGVIADREENVNKKQRAIKIARDKWEPALTKLVESVGERFSTAFDRIGCAGEIRISQHEDFDKWAIDILVKFRDSEKLQLLTGERQSGGERSLTTIMYLMSLTEEARTPFSLVDEINQGMDARAERAVHNSLVEVTCKPDSGQYFLITPKLLPDLLYHERMKILCVNNGEWLPEEVPRGDLMSMIDTFVRAKGGRGNSAA